MVASHLTRSALCFAAALFTLANAASPYNTFDGAGFPACNAVASVVYPKSVAEAATIVKNAAANGTPVRASGGGHSWYNTMCADDANTIILKTEYLNGISNLDLAGGSVVIEGGVTFLQLATWLHQRGAAIGYTLVNWNITIGGAVAMGAHRSSLREDSMVAAGALSLDIINGNGDIVHIDKSSSDTWLAATTSLGLLGVIARIKFRVFPDFKVYANQKTLDESAVLNGDINALIAPYATANLWWWPGQKKFHQRFYDVISINDPGDSLQNTFGLSSFEASVGTTLLNNGVTSPISNSIAEWTFFQAWSLPNFHDQSTQLPIILWPTTGWAYDVLIGGIYADQKTEWEYGLHGKTLELAVPMPYANALLKRVRRHFDESAAAGKTMYSTYRSGINIKFGKPYTDLLGQVTPTSNADWSKGAIMFDFPRFVTADGKCYNEQFYLDLAKIIVDEFPARPHWTKNTREVFQNSVKNLDADHLRRFAAVRAQFDPKKTFKSVVGQIIGVV